MTYWLLAVACVWLGHYWLRDRHAERKRLRAIHEKYLGCCRQPRVGFFDHEGNQILLLDLTYCTPQEATHSFEEFRETLSNQPLHSIHTTLTIIDLTDARFTPESIEEMEFVITENRHHFARLAFMGKTMFRKDQHAMLRCFVRRYPFFMDREDALDFVEHDDEFLFYPSAESVPRQRTAHAYDLALLCELFSRLLRYPDDEYWATTQECLSFFGTAKTRIRRLMTAFADQIRDLSTEQLQALYVKTFVHDAACSLEMGRQLGYSPKSKQDLIDWMERELNNREVKLPEPRLPTDHISTGLFLQSWLQVAVAEDFGHALWPAIDNLIGAMKGRNSPFEKLLTVMVLALDTGGARFVYREHQE